MGVNYPDVRYVINFGSPGRSLEGHIQQLGRGGRDGLQAHNFIIVLGRGLSDCEPEIRKIFREESTCIRVNLFKHFDEDTAAIEPKHLCCSHCTESCMCAGTRCSYEIPIFEMSTEKSLVAPTVKRVVTEIDKQEMMTALQSEKDKLTFFEGGESVSGAETLHGFSDELIAGVIQNLSYIDSSKDICTLLPIFDIHHARIILELINEFLIDK